ncbi:MAG: PEGA domain-containing protein [Caldisericia bacterium]|nr:PEGA domain-containing protein [Caldisericia bacterium]
MKNLFIIIFLTILCFSSCLSNKGTLTIDSYPKEAEVYLNGENIGNTPISIKINVGKYSIEVKKEGYKDYKKEVEIKKGRETIVIANLERKVGGISVKTEPDGATVYVDGKNYGLTPLEIYDLETGKHEVLITKEGYKSIIKVVEVKEEIIEISEILIKGVSKAYINSNPRGATVIIDGKEIGKTPLEIKEISLGRHFITLKALGYEEMTKTIDITENINTYTFNLVQLNHALIIETEPEGATVYIDDSIKGVTPIEIKNLTPLKKYKIRIELSGYLPYLTEVTMPKDGSIFLPKIKLMKTSG